LLNHEQNLIIVELRFYPEARRQLSLAETFLHISFYQANE